MVPDNAEFGHFKVVVLLRTAKKLFQETDNARTQPLFFSLKLLFGDVAVTVAVVVFLKLTILFSAT